MRNRACLAIAALAISACGGGHDIVGPPPPPAVDSIVSLKIMGLPSDTLFSPNAVVTLSAQATSSLGGKINYVWTLSGSSLGTGNNISVTLVPGLNQVCLSASVSQTKKDVCVNEVFMPAVTLRVVAADPASETLGQQLKLILSKAGATASCDTDVNGLCTIRGNLALQDSLQCVLDAPSGTARLYHPMLCHVTRSDFLGSSGITLIAVPFQYQVTVGIYSGQKVPIDLNLAYTAGSDSLSFYIRGVNRQAGGGGRIWYSDISLPASNMPLPVNILVKPERIDDAGVATIGKSLDSLKKILGWNITQTPVVKDTAFWARGVVVFFKDSLDSNGNPITGFEAASGGYDTNGTADIDGGLVHYVHDVGITSHITMHEMLHVLGFGHGCAWHSVMNEYCDWFKVFPDFPNPTEIPTATDIAYLELMYRIRDLERKYNTQFSLGESHQGERVLMLGLQEELITHLHP